MTKMIPFNKFNIKNLQFGAITKRPGGGKMDLKYLYPDGTVDALRIQTPPLTCRFGIKHWLPDASKGYTSDSWSLDLCGNNCYLVSDDEAGGEKLVGTNATAIAFVQVVRDIDNAIIDFMYNNPDAASNAKKQSREIVASRYKSNVKNPISKKEGEKYPAVVPTKINFWEKKCTTKFWTAKKVGLNIEEAQAISVGADLVAILYAPSVWMSALGIGLKYAVNEAVFVKDGTATFGEMTVGSSIDLSGVEGLDKEMVDEFEAAIAQASAPTAAEDDDHPDGDDSAEASRPNFTLPPPSKRAQIAATA